VGGIEILPKHIVEPLVTATDNQGAPRFVSAFGTDTPPSKIVGSGPYRMLEYTSSERIVLEKNPYYWRKDSEGNQQPYIDRYVVQITESTDAALVQFRSGGLDSIGVSANYFALMKREEERGGFKIYEGGPSLSSNFVMFNLNQGRRKGVPVVNPIKSRWFNTLEFRQAIAHAIDRPRMINNTFQGLGTPQTSPIPVQSPYYLAPEDGLPVYEFNIAKAKELLQKAGFKYNAQNQLVDAENNLVSFSLTTNAEANLRVSMAAQIKQDLSKIGMDVNFTPIAFNTLVDKLDNTFDWDMILLGFSGAGIEPDGGRNIWSVNGRLHAFNQNPGEGQEPLEGREVADWEAKIDRLYVQGSQQLDENKRKAVYAEAQKLILTQAPFIYLVNPISMSAVRDRVENVRYTALGGALWNIYELRVQQD
jgi:peptide/nickel transport system substrate-binding protein